MESPKRDDDESHGEAAPAAAASGLQLLLHEMLLRARWEGEEPDLLPDEQLRSNDQLQQDEMLALEAIYGDNIGILSAKDGLQCFQVHVHWEIPDGISISAELSRGDNHDQNSRFFDTFSVQHLAPISLTCLMPPSYPSHRAPYFTLSSQWLDAVKVSSLCLMLDTIWTQHLGQEVIYGWVQWLQSSALSHLGFDDGILIQHPDSMMGPVNVRAVAEIASVESVAQWLISYNEEQCHESFLSGLHDCMICFTEYAASRKCFVLLFDVHIVVLPSHEYQAATTCYAVTVGDRSAMAVARQRIMAIQDGKQQPYVLLGMPGSLLCTVPRGGAEELRALWSPRMQAAQCRP
uniref:RWD domain-containing protein n=1 Tax=Oryza punctata TaxID=4537 RepID=A0A0E0KUL0_ORYPU